VNTTVSVFSIGIALMAPILWAALGEVIVEQSGVLNIGIEGVMLIGAFSAAIGYRYLHALSYGLVLAIAAGAVCGLVLALLYVRLGTDQIVTGILFNLLALGFTSTLYTKYLGGGVVSVFPNLKIPLLGDIKWLGPILFHQNALVYASWALVILTLGYLYRTRTGLHLRAVGESPQTADVMGVNVARYRYAHTLAGGLLAGVAGAYYSLAITPNWIDGMTSGAGWIAIALVIFAFWRPELTLAGAYLFGLFSSLGFVLQAHQVPLPPELFGSLPYVMTVAVLVIVSTGWAKQRLGAPASLGVPYVREER
jgi:ABC-type uncharacterized transport system permease subunit